MELKERLESSQENEFCRIYDVSYFSKSSEVPHLNSIDSYDGPVLILRMIEDGGPG